MTFTKFLPVPIMIGVVAALWMVVSGQLSTASYPLVPWVPFIGWALYFMAGAKLSRLHKEAIGLTGGIVAAAIVLIFANQFGAVLGQWTLPVIVFFVAFFIVLLELTDWFELAPAYFFSFAGYFAYLLGKFAGTTMTAQHLVWFWALIMIGLALGVLTAKLRKWILTAEGVPESEQQTIFDREQRIKTTEASQAPQK